MASKRYVRPMRHRKRTKSSWPRDFGRGKVYEVIGKDVLVNEELLILRTGPDEDNYELVYPDETFFQLETMKDIQQLDRDGCGEVVRGSELFKAMQSFTSKDFDDFLYHSEITDVGNTRGGGTLICKGKGGFKHGRRR